MLDAEGHKQKTASNREFSAEILVQNKIPFESKNGGAHLIVSARGRTFDFWPGTGKYAERGCGYRRGVFNLLKDIREDIRTAPIRHYGEYKIGEPATRPLFVAPKSKFCFHCKVEKSSKEFRAPGCVWCKQCESYA